MSRKQGWPLRGLRTNFGGDRAAGRYVSCLFLVLAVYDLKTTRTLVQRVHHAPCQIFSVDQNNVGPTSSSSNEPFPLLTPPLPRPSELGPSTPSRPPTPPPAQPFLVRYPRNLDCKREAAASRPSLLVAGPARAPLSRTMVEEGWWCSSVSSPSPSFSSPWVSRLAKRGSTPSSPGGSSESAPAASNFSMAAREDRESGAGKD